MRLWRVTFPTTIFIWGFVLFNLSLGFCQNQGRIFLSEQKLDSLENYYQLSKSDSLSLSERLTNVSYFLKGILSSKHDSLIYNGFMQKTWLLGRIQQYDSAIAYSLQLYDFAKRNQDTTYIIRACSKLGLYNKNSNQLAKAFEYYNEVYRISRIIGDSTIAGRNLLYMSNIQAMLGDYSGSKTTAIDGVKYLKNTNDIRSLSGLYHSISVANSEQNNNEEALKYNILALALNTNDSISNALSRNSILSFKNSKALIYANQKKYKEATSILLDLKSDTIVKKNKRKYARVIGNLGYIYWLQDSNNEKTEKLLLESREIRNEIKDVQGLIASNIYLTKYFLERNKLTALKYAEEAYQNAKTRRNLISIIESLGLIFQLKEDTKEEAQVFYETYLKLTEINQSNREIYAVTKYENDKLTNENLVLKAKTAKKERQEIMYLSLGIISILIAGFIIYFLRQRYKKEKIRGIFNAETRISKRLHDELANDVYHVMTQLQNDHDPLEVLDKLENIYSRTRDISRENSSFDTGENFAHELEGMLSSYSSDDTKIIIKDIDDIHWKNITSEKKIVVHRIIQELMVNMKKHSQAGIVAVTFKKIHKLIEISYADNGVGVEKNDIFYSNGLQNAENRIKSIGGSFIFDSEKGKGFKAKLFFPS